MEGLETDRLPDAPGQKTAYPKFFGFEPHFSPEELAESWEHALTLIRENPGDKDILLKQGRLPYVVTLTKDLRPEDAHLVVQSFFSEFFTMSAGPFFLSLETQKLFKIDQGRAYEFLAFWLPSFKAIYGGNLLAIRKFFYELPKEMQDNLDIQNGALSSAFVPLITKDNVELFSKAQSVNGKSELAHLLEGGVRKNPLGENELSRGQALMRMALLNKVTPYNDTIGVGDSLVSPTFNSFNIIAAEALGLNTNGQTQQRIAVMQAIFPKEVVDAFLRDVARVVKRKQGEVEWPDFLPKDVSGPFENPFQFPEHLIGNVGTAKISDKEFAEKIRDPFSKDISEWQRSQVFAGFFDEVEKQMMRGVTPPPPDKLELCLNHPLLGLHIKERALGLKLRNPSESKKMSIANSYFNTLGREKQAGNYLIGLKVELAKAKFSPIPVFLKEKKHRDLLCKIAVEADPMNAAVAVEWLADVAKKDPERLIPEILGYWFQTKEDYEDEYLQYVLFCFAAQLGEHDKNAPIMVKQLLSKGHGWADFYYEEGRKLKTGAARGSIGSLFAPKDFTLAAQARAGADRDRGDLAGALEAYIDEGFDSQKALNEIRQNTSRPLLEPVLIDMTKEPRRSVSIFLLPPEEPGVATFGIGCTLTSIGENGLKRERVELQFVNGKLMGKHPGRFREIYEKIGIYAAHIFFVRQNPEALGADVRGGGSGNSANEGNGEGQKGGSEADRIVTTRDQKPLTIDIREDQKTEDDMRKKALQKLVGENAEKVRRLLKGDLEGINLDEVYLHQAVDGLSANRRFFERVPSKRLKEHLDRGDLANSGLWVLAGTPHTKALGFHISGHKFGDENRLFNLEPDKKSTESELAYDLYLQDGLTPLSWDDLQVTLCLLCDVKYVKESKLVTYVDENGKNVEFLSGAEVQTDNTGTVLRNVKSSKWSADWEKEQERVLLDEIADIQHSDLAEAEKRKLIKDRQVQIANLPEQSQKTIANTYFIAEKKGGAVHAAKVSLGREVTSKRTFNQGTYVPIGSLVEEEPSS